MSSADLAIWQMSSVLSIVISGVMLAIAGGFLLVRRWQRARTDR